MYLHIHICMYVYINIHIYVAKRLTPLPDASLGKSCDLAKKAVQTENDKAEGTNMHIYTYVYIYAYVYI
jgi:hypothetical protein